MILDNLAILTVIIIDAIILAVIIILWRRLFIKKNISRSHDDPKPSSTTSTQNNSLILTRYILDNLKRTNEKQDSLVSTGPDNNNEYEILTLKKKFLEIDLKALQEKTDEPSYWSQLFSLGTVTEPLISGPTKSPQENQEGTVDDLKERIAIYETRINSLEKFKSNFFDLNKRAKEYQKTISELSEQLELLSPVDNRSQELQALLDKAEREKTELKNELDRIETEFQALFKSMGTSTKDSARKIEQNIPEPASQTDITEDGFTRVQDIMANQANEIDNLKTIIDQLTIEIEDLVKIKKCMSDMSSNNAEMSQTIEILQDENQFMQDQIKQLLKDGMTSEQTMNNRISDFEEKLAKQMASYADLEKKYASLEKEYLEIYEELHKH